MGLVRDDEGVLRVGLPVTPLGVGGMVDGTARDTEDVRQHHGAAAAVGIEGADPASGTGRGRLRRFVVGAAVWLGGRDRRRGIAEQVDNTALPRWAARLTACAGALLIDGGRSLVGDLDPAVLRSGGARGRHLVPFRRARA